MNTTIHGEQTVLAQLESIAKSNGGILRPSDVIREARPVDHPLHNRFEWDNSKAASEYRLWQARELIASVHVTIEPGEGARSVSIRAFVSLKPDREQGGYRPVRAILSDAEMLEQALSDALEELSLFRRKYQALKQLSDVFEAIDKVAKTRRDTPTKP